MNRYAFVAAAAFAAIPALTASAAQAAPRNFECNTPPPSFSHDTGHGKIMIDAGAGRGGLSFWDTAIGGRDPIPDINLPLKITAETSATPGQEVYKFTFAAFTGELVHDDWQDDSRPNDWSLFVSATDSPLHFALACHDTAAQVVAPPSLKQVAKSHDFDCVVQEGDGDGVFPTKGAAHVRVDANRLQVITTLSNLNVNGLDNKTVELTYPLKNYFEDKDRRPFISWAATSGHTGSLNSSGASDQYLMTTDIPGDWPSWLHKTDNALHYYAMFTCRMAVTAANAERAASSEIVANESPHQSAARIATPSPAAPSAATPSPEAIDAAKARLQTEQAAKEAIAEKEAAEADRAAAETALAAAKAAREAAKADRAAAEKARAEAAAHAADLAEAERARADAKQARAEAQAKANVAMQARKEADQIKAEAEGDEARAKNEADNEAAAKAAADQARARAEAETARIKTEMAAHANAETERAKAEAALEQERAKAEAAQEQARKTARTQAEAEYAKAKGEVARVREGEARQRCAMSVSPNIHPGFEQCVAQLASDAAGITSKAIYAAEARLAAAQQAINQAIADEAPR